MRLIILMAQKCRGLNEKRHRSRIFAPFEPPHCRNSSGELHFKDHRLAIRIIMQLKTYGKVCINGKKISFISRAFVSREAFALYMNSPAKYTIYIHAPRNNHEKGNVYRGETSVFPGKLVSRVKGAIAPAEVSAVKKPWKFSTVTSVCCYAKIRKRRERTWKGQLHPPRIKEKTE